MYLLDHSHTKLDIKGIKQNVSQCKRLIWKEFMKQNHLE